MSGEALHVVFDLDDTLYSERDYVLSCFDHLGQVIERCFAISGTSAELKQHFFNNDTNPIQLVWDAHALPQSALLEAVGAMRAHDPQITLRPSAPTVLRTLDEAGVEWSILTDGRSVTQRSKISALGLDRAQGLFISGERGVGKPDQAAFENVVRSVPAADRFAYIGDNPRKDFIAPNAMGWQTVMLLDDGANTHSQAIDVTDDMKAQHCIHDLSACLPLLGL